MRQRQAHNANCLCLPNRHPCVLQVAAPADALRRAALMPAGTARLQHATGFGDNAGEGADATAALVAACIASVNAKLCAMHGPPPLGSVSAATLSTAMDHGILPHLTPSVACGPYPLPPAAPGPPHASDGALLAGSAIGMGSTRTSLPCVQPLHVQGGCCKWQPGGCIGPSHSQPNPRSAPIA